jgi:nucleoid-associated protein YgaU
MSRVLLIVSMAGILMATEVAGASPANQIRVPVTIDESSDSPKPHDSVIVEKGDHLWKISARRLGEDAGDTEIAPYWRHVVEVNTPRLRSGDPDLIFPGEVVELPATRERP